ncbi:MAG: ABC transporter ATP-binding protein [Lachnospiraceae bacterium]|nr:ABC transporter ATP-binding protein [Lachnospiraceae bacterium]
MDILKVENLTKIYGSNDTKVVALDHLHLTIPEGQFVSVMGPSGSGKSTFLHMLGGVDIPTEGKVWIDQTDIAALNETKMAIFRRRNIGLIYQAFHLVPTLTVEKNIMLPMLLDGRKPDREEFQRLVELLGLSNRLQHFPDELSGGQKQRTAIGRALLCHPAVILADEPTGNLDQENTKSIITLLKQANQEYRQTIVMITHDEEIAQAADRMIQIEDGRIVSDEVTAL